ncbi:MAG: hypothetical protein H6726_22465 [Sandaracinaceae bacterium]|nr:hypothetical protein [Sandaracinaceae bacterium]
MMERLGVALPARTRFGLFAVGVVVSVLATATGCGDPIPITLDEGLVDLGSDAQLPDAGPMDGRVPDDLGPDADVPDQGSGIILEVGFGPTGGFMVAPGTGTATAVMGVQGGYHLDIGFRVRGLTASDFNSGEWIISYEFRTTGGQVLSEPISRVLSLVGVSFDGVGQVRSGDRAFFLSNDPSPFNNTAITLEVSLTRGTLEVVDTADVTLVVP